MQDYLAIYAQNCHLFANKTYPIEILLSAEGNLYMWGWNGHGQLLMRDEISIQDTPAKTHSMMQKCAGIKCGGWSTLVTYDPHDPALSPAMVPYHNRLRDQGVTSITP